VGRLSLLISTWLGRLPQADSFANRVVENLLELTRYVAEETQQSIYSGIFTYLQSLSNILLTEKGEAQPSFPVGHQLGGKFRHRLEAPMSVQTYCPL
jgi:hypothetical protein